MQTIITKYHAAGHVRAARVSATSTSGVRVYLSPEAVGTEDIHVAACKALAARLQWTGTMVGGSLKDGSSDGGAGDLPRYPRLLQAHHAA